MRDYTDHQKKIIKRFYENRDQLDEQRLAELVTSLYLATTDKQREKLWTSAQETMERLEVPKSRVEHVLARRDPALLAEVVKDVQSGVIRKSKPAR
ncbi:MAG: hypothetical protein KF774_21875 [Planctomyces sp.]|nr:hypothetical protein [Planctomyces sp.]